jgi:CRP/FNR family cyclic AMP-dependent transcriptional regulator
LEEKLAETVNAKVSQDKLVDMVGTTRSRVGFFLKRSRKLGFISYNGELHLTGGSHMHSSLLKICLHD